MSCIELGGFAENPEAIDGTEEDFNAFNFCLACDYYNAVLGEDFESLGECLSDERVWTDLMTDVAEWLNYDFEIGKGKEEEYKKLVDGTIITYKNRTFIEACYEHGWTELADKLKRRNEVVNRPVTHIGVIGCTDHSKTTLTYAIQKTLEQGKLSEEPKEYPCEIDIKSVDFVDNGKPYVRKRGKK